MFCGTSSSTALCCNTFKPPQVGRLGVNRHKIHIKAPPFAKPSSSSSSSSALGANPPYPPVVLSNNRDPHREGSRSSGSHEADPSSSHLPNRVGVMGGMSALSTLRFLQKLVQWSYADGGECLPFIVCSDPPQLSMGVGVGDTVSTSSTEQHPIRWNRNDSLELKHAPIVDNLHNTRAFLQRSGVRCIVLPCHILPAWQPEISEGCVVPFLHIGECVAQELKAANLKPIEAGSSVRIGVLADDVGLAAQIYQKKLENQGFEVILPDRATMEHTVIPAIESIKRKDMEGARNLLRIAIQVLLVRAVNMIILASADMSTLLPEDDPLLKKCIDPMDALARATIQWAKEAKEEFKT